MGKRRKVCVVDDEKHVVELLVMSLKQHGYETCSALDGEEAVRVVSEEMPDLVLLDLMLPGIGGLEVCRLLKQAPRTTQIPVIMLTAKSEEADKVIGLGIGADDYVTKPFGLRELLARIEVVLRRAQPAASVGASQGVRRVGSLAIDLDGRTVELDGEQVSLSPTELSLLVLLTETPGRTVRRGELERETGVTEGGEKVRSLDVHISNLRKKLGCGEPGRPVIETVRAVGYRVHV